MGYFVRRVLLAPVLFVVAGCTPRQVAFVADSMGYYDKAVIEAEIESGDHNVVRYHTVPGATTWSHPDLTAELFAPDVDTIVVTFGLNETRYLRGDADAQPQRTLAQVLASWNTVKTQAAQNGKCLVWVNTQTATPLNTYPTSYYIGRLNTWTANNTIVAQWRDPVNYNVTNQAGSWVKPEDGFHLRSGSWGPHAYGEVIRNALDLCP
jgi:hypothetical protein